MGKAWLQSDRNATLLIDVLRFYGKEGKFQLHDFVSHAEPSASADHGLRR